MYRTLTGFLGLSLLILAGCGGSGASISGKVTAKNEKVTSGTLNFNPVEGGKPATGVIGADGTFTVSGATPGKNKLTFSPAMSTEEVALKPGQVAKPAPFANYLLKVSDVELKSGPNTLDVELIPPLKTP